MQTDPLLTAQRMLGNQCIYCGHPNDEKPKHYELCPVSLLARIEKLERKNRRLAEGPREVSNRIKRRSAMGLPLR